MKRFDFIAAPFTPFAEDGSLQLATIERQAEHLIREKLRGAFVCGTTGEGASLTEAERMEVAQRWCEVAGGELEIIVHVGHTSLPAACALAEHAARCGARGVAALAPYFFKPRPPELVEWCAHIAAAAPELPFYFYHLPGLTGVPLAVADFLPAVRARIPNFAGVKFTHEDLMDYGRCLTAAGKCEMFFGRDEILLAGLAHGARSAVGSTYNFLTPLFRRVVAAFDAGDLAAAQSLQAQARAIIAPFGKYGGLPPQKLMSKWTGLDCGPVRLPLRALAAADEAALRSELEQAGFFDPAVSGCSMT